MTPLVLVPDAERIVSRYLREHPDVAPLVGGERVYTALPANSGTEPLVLVQRIGGVPPFSRPFVLDEAELQIDAWGGSKAQAWTLAETVRQALVDLPGVRYGSTVTGVVLGSLRWQPEGTWKPPRPRYLTDATLYTKPSAEQLVSSSEREQRAAPAGGR